MAIQLFSPVYLHEKGKRKNNQDAIYPVADAATAQDRLFMVCDGVGGANKGEIASRMVCDLFHAFFNENGTEQVDENYIAAALRFTEQKLTEYTQANEEANSMSTTLTLLYFDDTQNTALVSWCGDSRIYHIRNGEALFVSEDHSLVQELIKRGEITPEEAQTHPNKNIILRAISSSENPTKADVAVITDIQTNDFFLLCTDGILEGADHRLLLTLLGNATADLNEVKDHIYKLCNENARDNFSMYLIKVAAITKPQPSVGVTKVLNNPGTDTTTLPPVITDNNRKMLLMLAGVAAVVILLLFGLSKMNNGKTETAFEKQFNHIQIILQYPDSVTSAKDQLAELAQKYPDKIDVINDLKNHIAYLESQVQQQQRITYQIDSLLRATPYDTLLARGADSVYLNNIKANSDANALNALLTKLTPPAPTHPAPNNEDTPKTEDKPKSTTPQTDKKNQKNENYD